MKICAERGQQIRKRITLRRIDLKQKLHYVTNKILPHDKLTCQRFYTFYPTVNRGK